MLIFLGRPYLEREGVATYDILNRFLKYSDVRIIGVGEDRRIGVGVLHYFTSALTSEYFGMASKAVPPSTTYLYCSIDSDALMAA